MQADRGINHASSGQGGEPRLGINFVLDGAQVVGWEERPLLFSSLRPLRLALAWAPDHSISLMQETGPYSGLIGGRGQGEPPLSN